MKALQYLSFGGTDVIQLNEVEKPTPKADEVLIKVSAVSVNPMDIKFREGYLQQFMPVALPYTPGLDAAGTIEAVGGDVTRLKVDAHVFATNYGGTYAQYVCLKEDQVALLPNNVDFNEGAALAIPLVTAYTFLVQGANLKAGQKVLIHGVAGGTGSIVLQVAKAMGAYVIGTATGKGLQLAKVLGANKVIDYKTEDFTSSVHEVDLVVDFAGGDTLERSFSVIKKGGLLLSAVMPPSEESAKKYGITAKFLTSDPSHEKLEFGKELVEQGKVKPQIVQISTLEKSAEAQDKVTGGGLNGKIILTIK